MHEGGEYYHMTDVNKILTVDKDLGGSKILHLRVEIMHEAGAPKMPGENYFWVHPYSRFRPHVRSLRIQALRSPQKGGWYRMSYRGVSRRVFGAFALYKARPGSGWRKRGRIEAPDGSMYPLFFERRRGDGKTVSVNDPSLFDMAPDNAYLERHERLARIEMLNAVLENTADRSLPRREGLHVYRSIDGDSILANYFGNDDSLSG